MKLDRNWRRILARAWSVRLIALAGVLSGIEVALPFFEPQIRTGVFAVLSALVTCAALVARIAAQKDLDE